jgi:hypothetical protein
VGNFSGALTTLLNRESLEKVLPVAGVLEGAPLLSLATPGKAKKEGAMQGMHNDRRGWITSHNLLFGGQIYVLIMGHTHLLWTHSFFKYGCGDVAN